MVYVNSINVYPSNVTLQAGKWYYGARAEVLPTNAGCSKVAWYSDNTGVATVHAVSGYIRARSAGMARIYAEATDGSGVRNCITVTVESNVMVESVRLNKAGNYSEGGCLSATRLPQKRNKLLVFNRQVEIVKHLFAVKFYGDVLEFNNILLFHFLHPPLR